MPPVSDAPAAPSPGRVLREAVPLVVGLVLAIGLLAAIGDRGVRADEAGLGEGTESVFATEDGVPVHCQDFTPGHRANAEPCLRAAAARTGQRRALWLGNSQLHGLNQPQPGQTTAIPILRQRLAGGRLDLLTLSQPNANLQEHYALFEIVDQRLGLDVLLLPAMFDDTREDGVRDGILREVTGDVRRALEATSAGQLVVAAAGDLPTGDAPTDSDMAALDHTVQERTERALNDWLDRHLAIWSSRPNIRSQFFQTLFFARNTVLGIDPSTERPMIPGRYRANMAALEAILQRARADSVRVLVYVPPIRSDVRRPYVPAEYAQYKSEVEALARREGASFVNLEEIVPGPMWGMKGATRLGGTLEYDFMHFQAGGHARLAAALGDAMEREGFLVTPSAR